MNGQHNNPPSRRADLWNLPSVWDLDAKMEWLIQDIVPLGAVTMLSAESGTGKTWAAYAIAGAVAHGSSFLGRKVTQRAVVYFDGENPLVIAQRNLKGLGVPPTDQLIVWGGWNSSRPLRPDAKHCCASRFAAFAP